MKTVWYITCPKWTVSVTSEDGVIIETPPIVQKFIGQPIRNLLRWAESLGGEFQVMSSEDSHEI